MWLGLDRSTMTVRFSFPSGVANLLTPFRGQQACGGAPCSTSAGTGQIGLGDRSDRSPESPAVDQRTPTREGPVGAGASWVALGSVDHLERPQTPWR
jgi:hypothetical protein